MQAPKKTIPIKEALRAKTELDAAVPAAAPVDSAAIDRGRKPVAARRRDAAAIRARAVELYGIPAGGLAAIPAVEAGFKFSPLDSDKNLNFLHFEALLEQAAALLERCAAERARYDILQFEKWKLQLELDTFFRREALDERERQAGLDTLAYERAALESAAERSLEENHRSAAMQRRALLEDLLASGFNRRMAARELAAWISAYPLKDHELSGDDASYAFDGAKRSKPDHLFEAARLEADEAAWEQASILTAERFASMAASEAARLRKESLDSQAKWALADIAFRGERAQLANDEAWEKAFQAQSPGGAFHAGEKIAAVERRFAADFREALARIGAARRGFKELLDDAFPFPEEGSAGYFDEVAQWVKSGQGRLAQITQFDQDYTLAVSLKQVAKSSWESGRAAAEWTFDVPEDLFPGQANVRLRGIGIAVAGRKSEPPEAPQPGQKAGPKAVQKAGQAPDLPPEPPKPEGFWRARVSLPAKATVRHVSGAAIELDQSAVPTCFLGRVADGNAIREPECAGARALHNASPIGKQWKIALSPVSTGGIETNQLDDVQIFLHVAVRGVKS
jgi:hypothetical protein